MRKSVSPIIATILLIMITILVSGSVFFWIINVQSGLTESAAGSIEAQNGFGCAKINIISMRGDRITVLNNGCETIENITLLIDGVLTNYNLDEPLYPGESTTISYTPLAGLTDHVVRLVLDNGFISEYYSGASGNTNNSGYTQSILEFNPDSLESDCLGDDATNVWFTGSINGLTGSCCGNDGVYDNFYNSSISTTKTYCHSGVFTYLNETIVHDYDICSYYDYPWDISFEYQSSFTAGSSPWGITLDDFNEDGKLDAAVTNYASYTVSVFMGNGSGGFGTKVDYSTGSEPIDVHSADFNEDGHADLVVVNQFGPNIGLLLGYGNGSFEPMVTFSTGSSPLFLAVGDFNEDDHVDVVVSNNGGSDDPQYFNFLAGYGNGSFAPRTNFLANVRSGDIEAGDFNNDDHLDVIVTNRLSTSVSFFLGYGNGSFATKTELSTGSYPERLDIGDFNEDNNLDFAVTNFGDHDFGLFLGNGDGTFDSRIDFPIGVDYDPYDIISVDLNNDSHLDILVSALTNGGIEYFKGDGNGGFATNKLIQTTGPRAVYAGDLNNDSLIDLVASNFETTTFTSLINRFQCDLSAGAPVNQSVLEDFALFNENEAVPMGLNLYGTGTWSKTSTPNFNCMVKEFRSIETFSYPNGTDMFGDVWEKSAITGGDLTFESWSNKGRFSVLAGNIYEVASTYIEDSGAFNNLSFKIRLGVGTQDAAILIGIINEKIVFGAPGQYPFFYGGLSRQSSAEGFMLLYGVGLGGMEFIDLSSNPNVEHSIKIIRVSDNYFDFTFDGALYNNSGSHYSIDTTSGYNFSSADKTFFLIPGPSSPITENFTGELDDYEVVSNIKQGEFNHSGGLITQSTLFTFTDAKSTVQGDTVITNIRLSNGSKYGAVHVYGDDSSDIYVKFLGNGEIRTSYNTTIADSNYLTSWINGTYYKVEVVFVSPSKYDVKINGITYNNNGNHYKIYFPSLSSYGTMDIIQKVGFEINESPQTMDIGKIEFIYK